MVVSSILFDDADDDGGCGCVGTAGGATDISI